MAMRLTGTEIGPGQFWQCLGERPVGTTIVTTVGPTGQAGFLGLSFAHVSAAPPIVLVSVGTNTSALDAIRASGVFAVNQLVVEDQALAEAFGGAKPTVERFAAGEWVDFVTGSPVMPNAVAVFDCKVLSATETEAAVTFFGQVTGVITREAAPLVAHRGKYRTL